MDHDNEEIPAPLDLGTNAVANLEGLSRNSERYTIEQLIFALNTTTLLTTLNVHFNNYAPTPENNRLIIDPLCRCIANLRQHNPNHPLRTLTIEGGKEVKPFLVAAKQFGIRRLDLCSMRLSVQSLQPVCRDNTYLKELAIIDSSFADEATCDEETAIPQGERQRQYPSFTGPE